MQKYFDHVPTDVYLTVRQENLVANCFYKKIGMENVGYINNGLMILAPGAFIILGIIIWVQRSITKYTEET